MIVDPKKHRDSDEHAIYVYGLVKEATKELIKRGKIKLKPKSEMEQKISKRKKQYLEYLKSDKWKKTRLEAIKLYKTCVLCNGNHSFHVHHRTYDNIGNEDLSKDVVLLCKKCHHKFHHVIEKIKPKRKKKKKIKKSGLTLNQRLAWKETQQRYKQIKRAKRDGII